jgi:hypothetical protein
MNKAVVIPAVLAASIACAPTARADCNTSTCDQQFISVMDSHGISAKYPGGPVPAGRAACAELAAGKPYMQVVLDVTAMGNDVSRADGTWVVSTAQKVFCP